ncbi:hypothetical protein [Marinobacter sp.]|uniref:hypothetical protein n=1 Tax=Marinobacter sp. TaxID=50741 RepID=UPI00384A603B
MYFRAIAVVLLITGLLAGAVLGPRWLMSDSGTNESSSGSQACDLLAGYCEWQWAGDQWVASLTTTGVDDRLQLRLQGPPTSRRMTAVLRGESMYLGEYPIPLVRNGPDSGWTGSFTVPLCAVDPMMTWRVDFHQGSELVPLDGSPEKLVFTAPAKG